MPVSFNVNKLWQSLAGKSKPNPVNIIAQRFLQVFDDHGVQPSQIPRLLPTIKFDDLKSEDALLAVLNHDLLEQTAHLFGIRIQWLEGVDDEIYEYIHCYKHPGLFFERFLTLRIDANDILSFPLRAITSTKKLDYTDSREQLLTLILVEKMAELDGERINRYHVYRDECDWSYPPVRIQFKAMVRIVCTANNTIVPLFVVKPNEMRQILDGKVIPKKFVDGYMKTNPSLDDFVQTDEENGVAMEVDEIPQVLRYIEDYKLANLITKGPPIPSKAITEPEIPQVLPEDDINVHKSGKRADSNLGIWKPARDVASALWTENVNLSIADLIRRIKKMPLLKASALTESAIRKHIADLAPPHIRGKAGRKLKKSP